MIPFSGMGGVERGWRRIREEMKEMEKKKKKKKKQLCILREAVEISRVSFLSFLWMHSQRRGVFFVVLVLFGGCFGDIPILLS